MTGPEHYTRAEELLRAANHETIHGDTAEGVRLTAAAQVHATLALAAATAEMDAYQGPISGYATGRDGDRMDDWNAALGQARGVDLRAELDAIGDLAYRADPGSPFVANALVEIHRRARAATRREDTEEAAG